MAAAGYPLARGDQRVLPPDYAGNVFVWDIDKTYLATRFSSVRGMARIPVEFAVDKRAIPGMTQILRGLRRGPGPGFDAVPLYFVSASPPQLRSVIERKMLLDGVQWDGITFKNWWGAIRRLKPGKLHQQVGFKLCALLTGRLERPLAREYLFGDNAERDAEAYALYAWLLHEAPATDTVRSRLSAAGVSNDDQRYVLDLLSGLPTARGTVAGIFIHLVRPGPPTAFDRFGSLVVPVRDAVQLARALGERDLLDDATVTEVASALG